VGLHTRDCTPLPAGTPPMPWLEATKNRNQVPGWRLEDDGAEGATALVREWKARDGAAATALAARLGEAAAAAGHAPASLAADEAGATVTARLATAGLAGDAPGSLSINDFILAAKLNRVATGDLEKKAKPKFWA
jgi:pterin-4a-carbinolamine dehydratase